ncbi:translation factor GTPase family protein [Streptomyces sp. NBC_01429]|uniref:translation factor GTPase family protein n=1 Tax=Streptomyces sp. NBC_01429 TaxID=2903862 RepID=UPI002E2A0ED2|nr:translation factor GTPase family protein [Streptomyces sp. NBC_01429]
MSTLNLGILAHVDAGKTSLTERLLHAAGVIDEIGRVDDGNTQTDSLALERRRGITIKSAVVSLAIDGVTVNLIDTPGHSDFIAEVERVLSVLDGAVLVISAVEGVQAQTRVLMRTLRRLRIPTLVFVNKIDRGGARPEHVLKEIAEKLTPAVIPLGAVHAPGTQDARFGPYGAGDAEFTAALAESLADHDDVFLAAYLEGVSREDDGAPVPYHRLRTELAAQTARALVHPVLFGSAITGAGMGALTAGIKELLPTAGGDPEGPVSGTVFKIERGAAGEKAAYVRMFSGTVRTRDRLPFGRDGAGKVTAIGVFDHGSAVPRVSVGAGRIGKLWGLGGIRIGDRIGTAHTTDGDQKHFSPPTLETVVLPLDPAEKGALHLALTQLAEQDPLIDLRQDAIRQETSVSLYGEVQKEVIQTTLADDFGVDVIFRETTTLCIERPNRTGAAVEFIGKDPNPFFATVGLRIDPAPAGKGIDFRLEVELGSMPYAFMKAVEDTARDTLTQGTHGWQVRDGVVTLTHSGFDSRLSTAGDFRNLTPLVLMEALRRAGTTVYEPMHRFRLDLPADTHGSVLPLLTRLRAIPETLTGRGASYLLEGDIPAARVHELEQRLPALTRGESLLESAFAHYRPVTGPAPARPRTDHDPLHRKDYLLRVVRRVAG